MSALKKSIILFALLSSPVSADDAPALVERAPADVSADVLLLDPHWDTHYVSERGYYWIGSGRYAFGDPRFDHLEECRGYAKRSFQNGSAFILRDCKAVKYIERDESRLSALHYLLRAEAEEQDDSPTVTLNGYRYGEWLSYGDSWSSVYGPDGSLVDYLPDVVSMTFLFVFPDRANPLVGDFTGDLHGAVVAAIHYFDYGVASGKLTALTKGLVEQAGVGARPTSWGAIKSGCLPTRRTGIKSTSCYP